MVPSSSYGVSSSKTSLSPSLVSRAFSDVPPRGKEGLRLLLEAQGNHLDCVVMCPNNPTPRSDDRNFPTVMKGTCKVCECTLEPPLESMFHGAPIKSITREDGASTNSPDAPSFHRIAEHCLSLGTAAENSAVETGGSNEIEAGLKKGTDVGNLTGKDSNTMAETICHDLSPFTSNFHLSEETKLISQASNFFLQRNETMAIHVPFATIVGGETDFGNRDFSVIDSPVCPSEIPENPPCIYTVTNETMLFGRHCVSTHFLQLDCVPGEPDVVLERCSLKTTSDENQPFWQPRSVRAGSLGIDNGSDACDSRPSSHYSMSNNSFALTLYSTASPFFRTSLRDACLSSDSLCRMQPSFLLFMTRWRALDHALCCILFHASDATTGAHSIARRRRQRCALLRSLSGRICPTYSDFERSRKGHRRLAAGEYDASTLSQALRICSADVYVVGQARPKESTQANTGALNQTLSYPRLRLRSPRGTGVDTGFVVGVLRSLAEAVLTDVVFSDVRRTDFLLKVFGFWKSDHSLCINFPTASDSGEPCCASSQSSSNCPGCPDLDFIKGNDLAVMGGCCCACGRRKKSADGERYAPEILYYRSESDMSPFKQPLTSPSSDSVVRRRRLNDGVGFAPLAQHDLHFGSDYFAHHRRGSSTTADFLTRQREQRDAMPRPRTEPFLQDRYKELDTNLQDVSSIEWEDSAPPAQQGSNQAPAARLHRRSSLEPIILEDHFGESSQLWLGVQHAGSEGDVFDEESSTSTPNESLLITRKQEKTESKFTEIEREESTTTEDFTITKKTNSEEDKDDIGGRYRSETGIHLQEGDDDKTLTRRNLSSDSSSSATEEVKQGIAPPGPPSDEERQSSATSFSENDRFFARDSPLVACVSSIADPVTRMRYLITDAMRKGLLDYETAAQLLEGQIQAGGIVCITTSMIDGVPCLRLISVEEGRNRDLVDVKMYERLKRFEKTVKTLFQHSEIMDPRLSIYRYNPTLDADRRMIQLQSNVGGLLDPLLNDLVPLTVGVQRRLIEERMAQEVLNQQIVSGGVVRGSPLMRIKLEDAKAHGLINEQAVSSLRHFELLYHGIRDPRTQEPTTYAMCVRRGILRRSDVIDFLTRQALEHDGWVRNCFTHEWLPITRAMHEGVVDVDMWEAVERAIARSSRDPALIHPLWLRPVSYFDLLKSAKPESGALRHCKVVQACNIYEGVYDPRHHQRITLCEALNRDLTDRWTAKRLLKAQLEGGGLVDIHRHERIPVSEALSRKVIDFPMAVSLVQQDRVVEPASAESVAKQSEEYEESETLEDLVEMGIVHPKDMLELLQADGYFKGIIDMRTGKNLEISSAAVKGLITKTTVLQVLGTDAQIKGVVDVTTGDTLSVGMATRHGIIDRHTGMRILERQVASGGLLRPPMNGRESQATIHEIDEEADEEKLQIQDAIKVGIIDPVLGRKLLKTEKARDFHFDSEEGAFVPEGEEEEDRGVIIEKIVKDQLCSLGGVLDPKTKEILPLAVALSRSLVSEELAAKLKERQKPYRVSYPTEPKMTPKFSSSLTAITESEDEEFSSSESSGSEEPSPALTPVEAARLKARKMRELRESHFRHRRMSTIYEEDEEDALDQTTGETVTLGALSRRAAVEINTGSRVLEGLDPAGKILIHHAPEEANPSEDVRKISLHIVEAFSQGLLSEPVAFRLLEAHLAQGGIPDPVTGERVSPTEALRRGYITPEMAEKLIVALKNLLQERAQMYVFRLNELLYWCNGMESEIDEYNIASESEQPSIQQKLLADAEPELRAIVDTLEEVDRFIDRDQQNLDQFVVSELVVLGTELQEKAEAIEKALREDNKPFITVRRPLLARCLSQGSSTTSTATSGGFALDEGLANNLARLQQLDGEADEISGQLEALSEEVVDAKVQPAEESRLDALRKQLEDAEAIHGRVLSNTPSVKEASEEAQHFVSDNEEKLAPELADELKTAKRSLDSKWETLQHAAADQLKMAKEDLDSAQDEEQRKAAALEKLSQLEPLLNHVREWASQGDGKLSKHQPAPIDEKKMATQLIAVEDHHKFIVSPQEKIAGILEQYRAFLDSREAPLVLSCELLPVRQKEVENLENDRHSLLHKAQDRLKHLTHAKDEMAQFRQGERSLGGWLSDAEERCRHGKQAPSDIPGLQEEAKGISALQTEIGARNADVRFLRMTSKRAVDAAKAYNSTLDTVPEAPSGDDTTEVQDPTEAEVEKLMTDTESKYDSIAKQAHERELLLSDVLKKRAAYEAAVPTVYPWLEQTEKQLDAIEKRPLPVEPNALQVQSREIEHILQDVTSHSAAVQRLEDTASDVCTLPQEAVEDNEREDVRNHAESTRKRYEDLRRGASEKSAELNSALSKSQGVSERLESLLNWLADLERQLQQNMSDTVSHTPKLTSRLDDANSIKGSIALREPEVAEVKEVCTGLLGGGDGQTTDSLHKRMAQLNNRFNQVNHGTAQRCKDLDELRQKVLPFENESRSLLQWMEEVLDKLNSDSASVSNEGDIPKAEAKIKDIRSELEAKRPSVEQTLTNGEAVVGDVRFSDVTPARDVMAQLGNTWEDLQEFLTEMEEEMTSRQEQIASFEKSMTDFNAWMKSVDDAVGDMRDSIVLETLQKQIDETQQLLDKWEDQAKQLDHIHDLCSFDAKTTQSPSRRRLRAHRRKNREDAPSEAKAINGKGAGAREAQLEDVNNMFDDLSDRITDKQVNLIELKETRENFDTQATELDSILNEAESEKENWTRAMDNAEKSDVNDMKKKLTKHKKWRENLLSHTNELRNASNLSSKLCEPKPRAEGVPEVQEQIQTIDARWKELLSASDEYVSDLESNFGALGDFNTRAAQLKDWLADKRNMLVMLGPSVCDRTVLATQNQQVEHLQKDAETRKPHIDGLIAISKSLPNTEEVQQDLSIVEAQWAELKSDLDCRKSDIDEMLSKVDELDRLAKEVCAWSAELCDSVEQQKAKLDSNPETLRKLQTQIEATTKEQVEPNAQKAAKCAQLANDLANATTDASSAKLVQEKSEAATHALKAATEKLDDYSTTLKDALEASERLDVSCATLGAWIAESNEKVESLQPCLTEDDLLQIQEEVTALQNVADEKNAELADVKKCADKLSSLCPADAEKIENKKCALNDEMEKLLEAISEAIRNIIDLLQRVHEFENIAAELEEKISEGENQLAAHKIIPHEARTDRHVEALKLLQGELASLAPQVVCLEDFGAELIKDCPEDDDVAQCFVQTANDVNERFRELKKSLDAECGKLADTVQQTEDMQEKVRDVMLRLNDLEEECDRCEPIGRQENSLDAQRDQMTMLKEKHQRIHSDVAELQSKYKVMVANGDIMDDYNLQREVDMIARKDQRLHTRLSDRWAEIVRISEQVRAFQAKMADAISKIKDVARAEDSLGEVASTVDDIIRQQKEFENLRQKSYEPLQASVQQLHYNGHALVISAAPSVPTSHISQALDELDRLWSSVSAAMNARSLNLQRALLSCGRFQDVYASLSSWLSDAEQLAASQKSPSWEYKVLLAQMEEQKVLQKMVASHQEGVTSFLRDGVQLSADASPGNRAKIDQQLKDFKERWGTLCDRVKIREAQLISMIGDSKHFHELTEAFADWLEETERCHVNNDAIGTQVERIQEQLVAQQAIHEQIMAKKTTVDSALKEGKELMMKCSGEDTIQVQEKLESIKTKYADLRSRSANRVESLEKCLRFSEEMEESHNTLNRWLDDTEACLRDLGLDVADTDATRQRKSIAGEEKKKLDALIETIHPEQYEPLLKSVKRCSKELSRVASRWGGEPLQSVIACDEARFATLKAALQRHRSSKKLTEEKLESFFEHAATCSGDLDALGSRLSDFVTVTSLDPEYLKEKIDNQKDVNEAIAGARSRVNSVSDEGELLCALCDEDDNAKIARSLAALDSKLQDISQKYDSSLIDRTLPLAAAYIEAKDELLPWLDETKSAVNSFKPPAILNEGLKQQQEELNALREDVVEHRPYVDKLNKIGTQLAQLIVGDNPNLASKVVQSTDDVNKSYASIREAARGRAVELENALGESNQFFERMRSMLEQLDTHKENLTNMPPVVLDMDKIKERMNKVKVLEVELGKLLPTYNSLKNQGDQLIARPNAIESSKQVVKEKVDEMVTLWDELAKLIEAANSVLASIFNDCQRFLNDAESLHNLLRELDTIIAQEVGEPAVDLVAIKQQMEVLETLCEEMTNLEKDLGSVRQEALELCFSEGSSKQPGDTPDTMEVKKILDELNGTWDELQDNVAKTRTELEEAMNAAVEFQEAVQRMLDLVRESCEKVDNLPAVATDLDTIKQQIEELKDLRSEAHSHQMELERLCNHGDQMAARATEEAEKASLQNSVTEMREAWRGLNDRYLQRQHDLETALLALGQLHHAINELAAWLDNTEQHLDSQQPPPTNNPKQVEIEMAKHKILWNDILAHKVTLDSITAAAHEISSTSIDDAQSPTKKDGVEGKMEELNSQWEEVNAKAQARQWELEECLEKAQGRQQELDLLTRWLQDKENELSQSLPYGGLPETAQEQLSAHLMGMHELEKRKEMAAKFLAPGSGTNQVEADLFREKLKAVEDKMLQKKAKLEEVLQQAQAFHDNLQQFMQWLTDTEKSLDNNAPPSAVMETLNAQLEKQKAFEDDVHVHRDILLELDKSGSHLKYFSQKQDGILIKNLLLSVHARWDKISSRTSERSHILNDSYKRAKQFYDSRSKLCDWLDSARQTLEDNFVATSDPDKIKIQLDNHKEFQRAVASKRPVYDATTRSGKALREKAHSYADKGHVDDKIKTLKEKWDALCAKTSERQNTLEEALMFSGRLVDAIESLLDWLYKTEPSVAADSPVHGDIHTVANLMDQHNALLSDIKTREAVVQSLEKSSGEMAEGADSSWVRGQMQELLMRWEALCKFAKVKEARLGSAKAQADEFQVSTQQILDWLSSAETSLRLNQQLPDDEFQLQELKAANHEFMAETETKRNELERTLALGNSILEQAHPDAITPLKHWVTVLQSRWEEVVTWAKQHGERLDAAIADVEEKAALLEKLMAWLKQAETTLDDRNDQPLPIDSVEKMDKLITEHQVFQDDMLKLQPDYDRLSRTCKRRPTRPDALKKRKSTDILSDDESPGAQLHGNWQRVWLKVLDRQQRLQHARDTAKQHESMGSFSFDDWRSRYMKWMKNKKSRVMDFFRHIDTDGDGKITRQEFIDGIIKSKFPTSAVEMELVADIFDQDKDGFIDYYEFVAALHPNKESYKPATDADKIEDEVVRQVAKCTCSKRFQVQQISENKYRFFMGSQFGDNQQLRLVRILRSTVMVRVGGGWMALDEFLIKNDPCRAKGRTNTELREKFILPQGASQSMTAFRTKRGGTPRSLQGSLPASRGSSRTTSPSRGSRTPDRFSSPVPPKSNGHDGKGRTVRSRASSGSSERSASSSLSSGGATPCEVHQRSGALSPSRHVAKPSPSRYSTPTASSASKSRTSQSAAATSTPRRSKIPTKGTRKL